MADRKPDKGRHQARKRAVELLFEAEARGLSAAMLDRLKLAGNDPASLLVLDREAGQRKAAAGGEADAADASAEASAKAGSSPH